MTSNLDIARHNEAFGLDGKSPATLLAVRLLLSTPRLYMPLAEAWDTHQPGTTKALKRLTKLGFVEYQGPIIMNLATKKPAGSVTGPARNFALTAAGKRVLRAIQTDDRSLVKYFPRATSNRVQLIKMLEVFDLEKAHTRNGLPLTAAIAASKMPPAAAQYWVTKLTEKKYLKVIDLLPTARELLPAHWRANKALLAAFKRQATFRGQFELLNAELNLDRRPNFPSAIDTSTMEIATTSAHHFEHDSNTEKALASIVKSDDFMTGAACLIEPKYPLTAGYGYPKPFTTDGSFAVQYQPDALFKARIKGHLCTVALEYERFQTRSKGWKHVEKFIGYMAQYTLPFETGALLFVLDTPKRKNSYYELIKAWGEYSEQYPERFANQHIIFGVTDIKTLTNATDALASEVWKWIHLDLGPHVSGTPVLHDEGDPESPYQELIAHKYAKPTTKRG